MQYDQAQLLAPDRVLAGARTVNDEISILYGILRRMDCGARAVGRTGAGGHASS
ncbi:hypothetical protein ABT189_27485 [Streptomyces sp900105755]|uniref:hypothetical protein n=1 Tax=Streptomyces sp. 900105755 TaxID=3154389 RepID=UPI00331DEC57